MNKKYILSILLVSGFSLLHGNRSLFAHENELQLNKYDAKLIIQKAKKLIQEGVLYKEVETYNNATKTDKERFFVNIIEAFNLNEKQLRQLSYFVNKLRTLVHIFPLNIQEQALLTVDLQALLMEQKEMLAEKGILYDQEKLTAYAVAQAREMVQSKKYENIRKAEELIQELYIFIMPFIEEMHIAFPNNLQATELQELYFKSDLYQYTMNYVDRECKLFSDLVESYIQNNF